MPAEAITVYRRGRLARAMFAGAVLGSVGCSLVYGLDGFSQGPAPVDLNAGDAKIVVDASSEGARDASDAAFSAYAQAVLADQPAAYYRFEETTLAPALDSSGNGHDGTYLGAVGLAVPGALAKEQSRAIHLDGKTAWVRLGDLFDFAGRAPMTLEAWVRADSLSTYHGLVTNENPSASGGYRFLLSSNEGVAIERVRDGGPGDDTSALPAPPLGAWAHLVTTYDGSVAIIFVDGQERARRSTSLDIAAPSDSVLAIGARRSGTTGYFSGSLDEIAIYDHALSAARIAVHHELGAGL